MIRDANLVAVFLGDGLYLGNRWRVVRNNDQTIVRRGRGCAGLYDTGVRVALRSRLVSSLSID